ncbi:MAG: DUF4132 domain-containing protein [Sandaracinaceae bacterium]|nr:DUF4132 domain-containing protein [Sandaracinaceae bacterium]
MTMHIEWTPEARARVRPRRAEDLGPVTPIDVAATWTVLREAGLGYGANAQAADELQASLSRLRARFEGDDAPMDLEPDEIAMWMRVATSQAAPLAAYLLETHGVARCVEAWLRTSAVQWWGGKFAIAPGPQPPILFRGLRAALLRAAPADYEASREHAAAAFDGADWRGRAQIVGAFPRDRAMAEELARMVIGATPPGPMAGAVGALHRADLDVGLIREATLLAGTSHADFDSLLDGYGADGVRVAVEAAARTKTQHEVESIARALSIVRAPEVAAMLAAHVGKKRVRKHASEYFARHPDLAETALRPIAEGGGRAAAMAAEMLAQAARAAETERGVADEAPLESLPAVLVAPPWRGGKRRGRKPIVVADAPTLDGPTAYHHVGGSTRHRPGYPDMDDEALAAWRAEVAACDPNGYRTGSRPSLFAMGQRAVPPAARLAMWCSGQWPIVEPSGVAGELLTEFGVEAIPGVVSWADRAVPGASGPWSVWPLTHLEAPAIAPHMALLFRRRSLKGLAATWLRSYPEAAIAGLLPAAVKDKGVARTAAERALVYLAGLGHEARIRERSAELGPKGVKAVAEILGSDPLMVCPAKPPKLSARYRPEALVRPTTVDGRALPLSAMQCLDEMLAFSTPAEPYAGIEVAASACDPRSLAEHAWSLATAWEASGSRATDRWMMLSLVHLADDEVVRRTTPALKNALVVDVLASIGSDAAAMELATIAARGAANASSYGGTRDEAERALDRIALAQGIDRERLDERLTPTLGLDERGGLTLDYGSRSFRVTFDEHLEPLVVAEDGKRSRTLPRTRKTDDAAAVEKARQVWDELREDVAAIGLFRIQALETAMLTGAEWSVDELETAWVRHPLMLHLTRRIVLCARRPEGSPVTFRVTDDGTYADVRDEPVELDADTRVFLPHPLRWPDDTLAAWPEVLADYELIQPFAQLARPRPSLTDEERSSPTLLRSWPSMGDYTALRRRLERCGWAVSSNQAPVLLLGDSRSVLLDLRSESRSGMPTMYVLRLVLRRDTQDVPWTEATEEETLTVLDQVGAG